MSTKPLFGLITLDVQVSSRFNDWLGQHVNSRSVYIGPSYVTANPLSFYVSASTNGAFQLVSDEAGITRLLSNVCPHRHKIIRVPAPGWSDGYMGALKGGHITCRGHDWVFNARGEHVAPVDLIVNSADYCTSLQSMREIQHIGGLVWAGTAQELDTVHALLALSLAREHAIVDFVPSNYRLHKIVFDDAAYGAMETMEVFNDCNHPDKKKIHPTTLGCVVDMSGLQVEYSEDGAVTLQVVPWLRECKAKANKYWLAYHKLVAACVNDDITDSTVGKVSWMSHHPDFTTVERYPLMVVMSRFVPKAGGGTLNSVEFYFPEEVLGFYPELAEAAVAAYMGDGGETEGIMQEDARLSLEMSEGKKRLVVYGQGKTFGGPMEPIQERAVYAQHQYLSRHWNMFKHNQRFGSLHVPGLHPSGAQLDAAWGPSNRSG